MQFTTEQETDNQIPFLDVLVRRERNKLTTIVYHKKTHTDHHLNYKSHHSLRVLAGVVTCKCLKNRAVNICDPKYLEEEIKHLDSAFKSNNFPHKVLDPILNRTNTTSQAKPTPVQNTEKERDKRTICIPYVRGVADRIDNVCRSIKTANLRMVFKPHRTIRHSSIRVKNKIMDDRKKRVIYEIHCKDCEKVYVGETGRTLKKRLYEHKQAW